MPRARVTGMVELRQIVNQLIQEQLDDYPDEDIKATQAKSEHCLRCLYRKIRSAQRPQKWAAVCLMILPTICSALWRISMRINISSPRQICSPSGTIRPERTVTSVDTPSEALAVSIGEHGRVDLPIWRNWLGTPAIMSASPLNCPA